MAEITISGTATVITSLEAKEDIINQINIYPMQLFVKITVAGLKVYLNKNHIIKIEL